MTTHTLPIITEEDIHHPSTQLVSESKEEKGKRIRTYRVFKEGYPNPFRVNVHFIRKGVHRRSQMEPFGDDSPYEITEGDTIHLRLATERQILRIPEELRGYPHFRKPKYFIDEEKEDEEKSKVPKFSVFRDPTAEIPTKKYDKPQRPIDYFAISIENMLQPTHIEVMTLVGRRAVHSVYIPTDYKTRELKSFVYVALHNKEEADEICDRMDNHPYNGMILKASRCY